MQLPIVAPAPLVTAHAEIFRDLFEHRCQFHHCQHDLTGLIVLDNTRLANLTRCGLERADKTTLSRFCSAAPWFQERVNDRRLTSRLQQTQAVRGPKADAILMRDDPLCAHGGRLCAYGDRHDHHGDDPSPLAHNPVTSHDGSGPVRLPVDRRVDRRYEACTRWAAFVHTHGPDRPSPRTQTARARFPKAVDPLVFHDPDVQTLHDQLRTTIDRGIDVLAAAMRHQVPCRVLVCDRWSLAEALVSMARSRTKDWIRLLKKPRNLETHRVVLQDAAGQPSRLEGPHMAVEDLVPLIPRTASQAVTVGDTTSWTFTLAVRIAGLGTGRLVVSCESADWTGPSAVLVTNRAAWSAPRIITLYVPRWPRETCSQDGKGPLGVDAYRMRNAEAMQKHGCLVYVAYAFLPLDGLPPSPPQGSLPLKTIGEACRQHAQARIEALILSAHEQRQRGQQAVDIFATLFAKQQPVMTR